MKKFIMLIFLLPGVISINAQVFRYKYLYSVKTNGSKYVNSLYKGEIKDVKFTNNMQSCFFCDKDGYPTYNLIADYNGKENNVLLYKAEWVSYLLGRVSAFTRHFYYFSSDYSMLTFREEGTIANNVQEGNDSQIYEKVVE